MAVVELTSLKSFPQLWKELRKLGWTAKRPTGLGVDYCYVPPSSSGSSAKWAMQEESYFDGVNSDDVNWTAQPTEDTDDSEVKDEGVLGMMFDAYDDDETGEEVDVGEADRCDIDDDKDVLREIVEICCRGDDRDNAITRAVIRNVSKTLQGLPAKRLIVTDNYYMSITLSRELLKRGYYHRIVDYQKGMGGVDQYDQLRLHRCSIQKSLRMQKYYKSVFLGIVDMAIVNGLFLDLLELFGSGFSVSYQ
ncbi:hypothetical protein P43SY_002492 [Pythium insidiosum]|uniref:PiggyBac transposable element-derived protein domain-containing protein n=1 Tax=Pythium insidiosum TaxID=114742 RepID=A0AAD5LAL7_PYTIN|nr:hypothetical protein P43SY_002492 [Pythium insidiosum]